MYILQNLIRLLISVVVAGLVMIIHESAKHYIGLSLMHPIYRKRQDNKVNVLKYIDPIGMILFVFTGVGWQKPADYNPNKFLDKHKGLLYQSLIGLMSNIIVMIIFIMIWLFLPTTGAFLFGFGRYFIWRMIQFNFSIVIVNLLPIPPFDMTKIIYAFNPNFYFTMIQNERILHAVFILLIMFNILNLVVGTLFEPITNLYT